MGFAKRLSINRIVAAYTNATLVSGKALHSSLNSRQWFSQPKVRSTIQRLGSTLNPLTESSRLTITRTKVKRCFAQSSNCYDIHHPLILYGDGETGFGFFSSQPKGFPKPAGDETTITIIESLQEVLHFG